MARRDRPRRVRRLPPAVGEVAGRHRVVLGRGVALLRHPREHAGRHRARRSGNAWGAMVSGCNAELRDRGVPARDRRVPGACGGRRGRLDGLVVGTAARRRPPRSRTTCAGSASSRATGSSDTCRTSAKPSRRSSGAASVGATWAVCNQDLAVDGVVARLGQLEPRCWWPATARCTAASGTTAAPNSPRSVPSCRH